MVVCEIKGRKRWPEGITKFHDKNLRDNEYVHYFICGDGDMGIYVKID